ncbi:sensor histidine kinase [Hutsoniella sourekii]
MNLRLWLSIFWKLLAFQLLILFIFIVSLINGLKVISWSIFLKEFWLGQAFWVWILALLLSVSLVFSLYLAYRLDEPYQEIVAKLNWLKYGKYQHPIFDNKIDLNWYDGDNLANLAIEELRSRMIQLSADLQEFSAAPLFVGESTREEIILEERKRIARELHDSVSQQLFASMMLLAAINEELDASESLDLPSLNSQLQAVEKIISKAQTEMRALLLHLRPIELNNRSLKEGLIQLLQELESKIEAGIDWDIDSINLESGIEDHLFRISQEAVSNTLRHADATHLAVMLKDKGDSVVLQVIDNGKGFDPNNQEESGNYGLVNIRERSQSLGGELLIKSATNLGTTIQVTIPKVRKGEAID